MHFAFPNVFKFSHAIVHPDPIAREVIALDAVKVVQHVMVQVNLIAHHVKMKVFI